MKVRIYKNTDGTIIQRIPANGVNLNDLKYVPELDELEYEDIEQSELPDRKYRMEWRKKNGGGVEVPQNLKESRDAIIRLNEIDDETYPFTRKDRELRISTGIATQKEIDLENEAKNLRKKVVK